MGELYNFTSIAQKTIFEGPPTMSTAAFSFNLDSTLAGSRLSHFCIISDNNDTQFARMSPTELNTSISSCVD